MNIKVCETEKIKPIIKEALKGDHDFLAECICDIIDKYSFNYKGNSYGFDLFEPEDYK